MVNKTINKFPKSVAEVDVVAPWADLAPKWQETVQTVAANVELQGFRKGQAPLEMVEQQQIQNIQQEFLKAVMPQALVEALQGTDVVPIDYPQYQIVSFSKGADLHFKARVTARPVVTVGNYKAIKVNRPALPAITDADVDKVVMDLFNRWKMRPQPQPQPNLTTPVSPTPPAQEAPDDAFAQAVGAANLADLRQKISQDLEADAKYNNELDYEEAILQEVEKITTVDLPDILIQDELNRMLVQLQRRVADMGLLMDDYLRGQNTTVEKLKQEWLPQAEKNVRMELGLSEIARQENVVITDEELRAEIDKIQDNRLKQQFEMEEPRMHLRHALRQTKTLNLLKTVVTTA